MAISPFPMFPDGNTWLHEARDTDITTFADSYSVGEFNAVFSLLDGPLLSDRQLLAPQGQSGDELSAWLLVLGSYGWAPVKLLSQKSLPLVPGKSGSWFDPGYILKSVPYPRPLPSPSATWNAICILISGLILAFCGRLWYLE